MEKHESLATLSMSERQLREMNRVSWTSNIFGYQYKMMIHSTSDKGSNWACPNDSTPLLRYPPAVILMGLLPVVIGFHCKACGIAMRWIYIVAGGVRWKRCLNFWYILQWRRVWIIRFYLNDLCRFLAKMFGKWNIVSDKVYTAQCEIRASQYWRCDWEIWIGTHNVGSQTPLSNGFFLNGVWTS